MHPNYYLALFLLVVAATLTWATVGYMRDAASRRRLLARPLPGEPDAAKPEIVIARRAHRRRAHRLEI